MRISGAVPGAEICIPRDRKCHRRVLALPLQATSDPMAEREAGGIVPLKLERGMDGRAEPPHRVGTDTRPP